MTSRGERNDRRQGRSGPQRPQASRGHARRPVDPDAPDWVWGRHAVEAALANPRRTGFRRLLAVAGKDEDLLRRVAAGETAASGLRPELAELGEISRLLPAGAVHQGLALLADPLAPTPLEELAQPAEGVLVLLDQVADPQNVGAVFRSAAAFGARGVILQDRRAPPLSGALAKASAGAVERTPCARVVNLSRALEQLADAGWRAVGLTGSAEPTLAEVLDGAPVVLVLGSEGDGMRRLVAEHCDILARIAMPGGFDSLNVATAASIALYEASLKRTARA